jgi:hypothetical protein
MMLPFSETVISSDRKSASDEAASSVPTPHSQLAESLRGEDKDDRMQTGERCLNSLTENTTIMSGNAKAEFVEGTLCPW